MYGEAPNFPGILKLKVSIKITEYNENKMVQSKDIEKQSQTYTTVQL